MKRTLEDKLRLVGVFEELRENGTLVQDIADKLNLPISTLYRWHLESRSLRTKISRKAAASVTAAIANLVRDTQDTLDLLDSAFLFMCWLRWPTIPACWPQGVTACLCGYAADKYGDLSISELDPAFRSRLCEKIRLNSVLKICSAELDDIPYFRLFDIDEQRFTEQDAVAELCRYLISYQAVKRFDGPSFSKAYRDLHDWDLPVSRWRLTYTSYRKFYREHFAASPFLLIERYFPSIEWTFSEFKEGFSEQIDSILNQPKERKEFFARSFAAQQLIFERMQQQSLSHLIFVERPKSLSKRAVESARDEVLEKMRSS